MEYNLLRQADGINFSLDQRVAKFGGAFLAWKIGTATHIDLNRMIERPYSE